MNKLETITAEIDEAIRFVLQGTEFDGDLAISVQLHHAPIVEGVPLQVRYKPESGIHDFSFAMAEVGKWPRKTDVTIFPSIPDTQLATDEDQPF